MEVGDSRLSAPKPGYGTLGLQLNSFWLVLTGLSPSLAGLFRHFSLASEEEAGPVTLHLPQVSLWDSVWTFPFSLAANKGIPFWFLFLPLLRCFNSGGSPSCEGVSGFRRTVMGSPIEESLVLRLHALTRGSFAACRALHQHSSRAILQTA